MEPKNHHNSSRPPKNRAKATTSTILGTASPQPRIDPQWERHYEWLLDLREQFHRQREQLVEAAAEFYIGPRRDPADIGTNTYDCDWALGMASSDQNALYEIDAALNRIHAGTYGICELTGKRISQDRLNAIPWTRFSAEAEQQLETSGQLGRVRIGHRESLEQETQDGGELDDSYANSDGPKET